MAPKPMATDIPLWEPSGRKHIRNRRYDNSSEESQSETNQTTSGQSGTKKKKTHNVVDNDGVATGNDSDNNGLEEYAPQAQNTIDLEEIEDRADDGKAITDEQKLGQWLGYMSKTHRILTQLTREHAKNLDITHLRVLRYRGNDGKSRWTTICGVQMLSQEL
jgi:hypothetical protein